MTLGVFIIGDEILSGKRSDKHFAKALELLGARGLALDWAHYLRDDLQRLTAAFAASFARGDTVFSFGGIGVTPDDRTRQAVAAALRLDLALHPQAERCIRERFGAETTPQRLRLGEFPVGSTIVPNPFNGIPGFAIRDHWFFPGFPVMAWPMLEWVLDQPLADRRPAAARIEESILLDEAPESALLDLMERVVRDHPGARLFSLPSVGDVATRRHLELGLSGDPAAVRAGMALIRAEVSRRGYSWVESAADGPAADS